ncbi:MAG: VWA domain-containing protein [Acidobacteriota bacterium]|nr:VWA domain-containing protein [Acidobacteriota bacterium]
MKENRTRIAIILDRSGSMQSVREATISGFNQFIRSQRELPGDVSVKLVQFDDQYDVVFNLPLPEVPELTQDLFVPRGMTALFDAQGRTIAALGEELAALPESERPTNVIVMTLTDGLENASKQYGIAQIAAMVKHQTEVYKWNFVFLGANQDAIHTGALMAIPAASSLTYRSSRSGTAGAFDSASNFIRRSRSGGAPLFARAEREAAMAEDVPNAVPAPPLPSTAPPAIP